MFVSCLITFNTFVAKSYLQRRRYLIGTSLRPVTVQQLQGDPNIDDTRKVMEMMKGNTASYISNIGFMFWVNSFFSGFLLIRLPFTVTETLRPLVQRDIALQAFDCSYVSSLSWYFITYFGLSGLNRILLAQLQQDQDDPDIKLMKQQQMNPMVGPMGPMAPGTNPMMPNQSYDPNPMYNFNTFCFSNRTICETTVLYYILFVCFLVCLCLG